MAGTNDLEEILTRIERFLNQQRELYGDLLPSLGDRTETDSRHRVDSPRTSIEMTPLKKSPVQKDQTNLFGEPQPVGSTRTPAVREFAAYPDEPWTAAGTLADLDSSINTCMKCSLGDTRTNFVFGVGNPNAGLVLVGEAPGADEDAQGEPFVGRAGQLLNKILEAIKFKREDVYICNILKCRPPDNREPLPEEVAHCEPYLWKQLELIKPRVILCLGRIAAKVLLKTNESLGAMRQQEYEFRGTTVLVTYHPAALLRNPHWKKPAWEDVQKARRLYDELAPAKDR
jgi:DNA polymerase